MNNKTVKKIRKEINSSLADKEAEMVNQIFDYFKSLSFKERIKIAVKIICKKL